MTAGSLLLPPASHNANLSALPFQLQTTFQQRMMELRSLRHQALRQNPHKPSVMILGAGPAGLIRAISALTNGNTITILERRAGSDHGRENSVVLFQNTVDSLHYFGVYQYLLERGMVFPFDGNSLNVRIKDLEQAMKAVLEELSQDSLIHYDSQVEQIVSHPRAKVDLLVRNSSGRQTQFNAVDLIVVAEGSHSHTCEQLLHLRRISILPSIPVIAAIFKDDRPSISSIPSFFQYLGKTLVNIATSVYYYTILLFKTLFEGEHVYNQHRQIAGSFIIPTPRQNYLGCGLSNEETEKMMAIATKLNEAKRALETARQNPISSDAYALLQQSVAAAQKQQDEYFKYWTGISFCVANVINFLEFVDTRGESGLQIASWFPLDHAAVVEIGADQSCQFSGTLEQTVYLVAGDALATADPTTALGCNSAINTFLDFHRFLTGLGRNEDLQTLLSHYNRSSERVISDNNEASLRMRLLYRPDAIEFNFQNYTTHRTM